MYLTVIEATAAERRRQLREVARRDQQAAQAGRSARYRRTSR
jgi:hypothetical protein